MIRKRKKFIMISIVVIIIVSYLYLIRGPMYSYDKNQLIENKQAYTQVAELYQRVYKETNEEGEAIYSTPYNEDGKYIINIYKHDTPFYITDKEYNSYKIVAENFRLDKQNLDRIKVNGEFVVFGTINGRNAFIYSVNDKEPKTFYPSEKNKKVYVEKVTDNWYYGCLNE